MDIPWRQLRLALLLVLYAASLWFGLKEGLSTFQGAETAAQRITGGTQLLYGVTTIGCLWALFARPRWATAVFGLWAAALTVTGALAPVTWGGAPWTSGLWAGLLVAAVAGLVLWGSMSHIRSGSPG